ncbi:bifunctional serine/threonine-protein kinase/ABC transporter substrate-binding protein [Nostoc sp. UHCC 0302]|uniref:bifunctional serine/threonine-protein kinase/ABC transporter substrate-binding protein n=1 Tax=Nostoc sp. UHCC 0302 TaxID=3134896 RepID=UPI00311C9D06
MVNGNPSIEVYCTRPTCNNPQNSILETSFTSSSTTEIRCSHCGMPLILGGHFLPLKLLVPDEEGGAFGRTFEAEDISFPHKPKRVIKQLHPRIPPGRLQLSPAELLRIEELFKREAIILEQLRHPKIPRALAFFSVEVDEETDNQQKFFYLVQDYIEGNNLAQELRERGKTFSDSEVINILKEILEILKYIHNYDGNQGAIHRDIKPANIILCNRDRRLYLIDFGAVKQVLDIRFPVDQSSIVLTRAFAPPEQFRGAPVSPASDLYALATTCLCLLTGDRNPQMLLSNSRWRDYVNVSDEHFANLLDWMLQYSQEDRPQSAQEVLDALSQASNVQQKSEQPPDVQQNNAEQPPDVLQNTEQPPDIQQNSALSPNELQNAEQLPNEQLTSQPIEKHNLLQKFVNWLRTISRRRGWVSFGFLVLLGVAIAIILNQTIFHRPQQPITSIPPIPSTPSPLPISTPLLPDAQYFSRGEDALLPKPQVASSIAECTEAYDFKRKGIEAFKEASYSDSPTNFQKAEKAFSQAIKQFQKAAKVNSSQNKCEVDPETWIYHYNSKVAQTESASNGSLPTIAVVIPGESNRSIALEILQGVAQSLNVDQPLFQILIAKEYNDNINIIQQIATYISKNNIPDDKYFEKSKILGVIGHYTSKNTWEAGKIYGSENLSERDKLVLISPTSTAIRKPDLREGSKDKTLNIYVFRTASNDSLAAKDLAEYMWDKLPQQKALIAYEPSEPYSQSLKKQFTDNLALTRDVNPNNYIQDCNLTADTPEICIHKANFINAKTLILAPSRQTIGQVQKIVKLANQKFQLLAGDVMYDQETLDLKDAAKGMVLAVFSHPDLATDFTNKAKEIWIRNVTWRTITSYDATQAFLQALNDLKSQGKNEPNRQDVYERLNDEAFSASGATAKIEFNPKDRDDKDIYERHDRKPVKGVGVLVQVNKNSNSDEYIFNLLPPLPTREQGNNS